MKGNVRYQSFPQRPCWPMIGRVRARLAEVFHGMAIAVRELAIMRILVTGASGQLGSYLARELLRGERFELVLWSRGTTGTRWGLELRPVDLADGSALTTALDQANPDMVIHAAAISKADEVRLAPEH